MSRLNHNMSTTSNSPAPSLDIKEEPRQKGARGGKRSVTHLSKAQLARKRANDREAQRNIRQRTKEHIESLEKKVKELESLDNGSRDSSIERVLQRNKQLELEIEQLRAQVRVPVQDFSMSPEAEDVMRKTVMGEWSEVDAPSDPWSASEVPTMPIVIPQGIKIDSSQPFVNLDVPVYPTPTSQAGAFGIPDETSQQLYTPLTSGWENPGLTAPVAPAWPAFAPTFQQPSRFTEQSNQRGPGFTEVINTQRAAPNFQNSTCWQAQPSIYAWQISTKIAAPTTLIDELMIGVIQSQRHLHMTADVTGQCLIGPSFPSVHVLFNQPGPVKPLSSANLTNMTLTDTMSRYSAVLSRRGFQLIPEKLASFMAMYRFVQWQISPCQSTYTALHEWQAPRPSQLIIPHPAWMDLPPWGKFRDKIIENQDRYGTLEFQNCYASNLNVNFPGDGMEALIFEDGQIKISPLMEKHLSDLGNMSMRKPFADKYPEFADVCRFDEV